MILDPNALSAFIAGEPAVGARLSGEDHVAIPVIVLGEFRYGIAGSRSHFVDGDRPARDARRLILAFDEFHDQRGEVRSLLEAEDRGDVGMVERRENFGVALKAGEAIRVARDHGGRHLD